MPLSNFSLDATNVIISPQRGTTGADLAAMATGQLGTDLGRMQIFVGGSGANVGMLPVRFHSATAAYVAGDYVVANGRQYRAPGAVAAGAFTASQWRGVVDSGGGSIIENSLQLRVIEAIDWRSAANVRQYYMNHSDTSWAFATCNADGTFYRVAYSVKPDATVSFSYAVEIGGKLTLYGDVQMSKGIVFMPGAYDQITFKADPYQFVFAARTTGIFVLYDSQKVRPAWTYDSTALSGAGNTQFMGQIQTSGPSAGIQIDDRNVAGRYWTVYSTNNQMHFFLNSFGDAMFLNSNGDATFNFRVHITGDVFTTTGFNFYETDNWNFWFTWKASGGRARLMHNANGQRMEVDNLGNMIIPGYGHGAGWLNDCDRRLKSNASPIDARDLDVPLYRYTRDQTGVVEIGPYAQDVQNLAPEHALVYDGPDGVIVSANLASLALEIALNARARVAALEAANVTPEPEPED